MKKLRTTKAMVFSSILVFGIAAIAYLTLSPLNAWVAQIAATGILGTLIPVNKYLREKQIEQLLHDHSENYLSSISRFRLKWYLVLLYGSLLLFAGYQLGGGLLGIQGGVVLAILSHSPQALSVSLSDHDYRTMFDIGQFASLILAAFLVRPIVTFLVGRWVGKKGNEYGIVSMIAIPIIVTVVSVLPFIVSPEGLVTLHSNHTKDLIVAGTIRIEILSLSTSIPIGLFGYWRGRKKMLNGYLQEIFKHVPKDKRAAVVESLYQGIVRTMMTQKTEVVAGISEIEPSQ